MFLSVIFLFSLLGSVFSANRTIFTAHIVSLFVADSDLPYTLELVQPAISIAVEKVSILYPNILWNARYRNSSSRCVQNYAGVYAAEEFYRKSVTAFMGPACTLALDPVARMASYWNVPLYTAGSIDDNFSNKDVFTTMTRLSFSAEGMSKFILQILKQFEWHHVSLIVEEAVNWCRLIKQSLIFAFENDKMYDVFIDLREFSLTSRRKNLTSILTAASKEARVFFLITNGETVRNFLLSAFDLGMGNGEYVFFSVEFFTNKPAFGDFSWYRKDDPRNEDARKIYESFLLVSAKVPASTTYLQFAQEVAMRSQQEFNTSFESDSVNVVVADFHDCVLLYSAALNETLSEGEDPTDGRNLIRKMWNLTFYGGITEQIHINRNGDRDADYTLYDLNTKSGKMEAVIHYYGVTQILQLIPTTSISWPNGKTDPPPDIPFCGFAGNDPNCYVYEPFPLLAILGVVLAAIVVIGLVLYRKMKLESELSSLWWKVKWSDIIFHNPSSKSSASITVEDVHRDDISGSIVTPSSRQSMSVGYYKGMKIAVKLLNIRRVHISRKLLLELKQLRDVTHENLIRFVGFCPEEPNIALLTDFSPRGSLRELLSNDGIKIDWPFRYSLISDIVEGMVYLHQSPITYHGRLKSTNCVIDGRFVVKLTDFGLRTLMDQLQPNTYIDSRSLFWTAPEHLREERPETKGSQKGDSYSFAIVLREIITRLGPYQKIPTSSKKCSSLQPEEVLERIRAASDPPFRPNVSPDDCPSELLDMLHMCWEEDPNDRPTFTVIKQQIRKLTKSMVNSNFLDNLLSRMEQYANNLEQLVEDKTEAFLEEKKKSEELLYEVLPRYVAEQLKAGHHVRPESFACVTIFFSDIVGFTTIAAESTPMDVVDLLNDLYTCFDATIGNYDVYKVETIGDAYMVVSGLPVRNGKEHAKQIARLSLSLRNNIENFRIRHRPERKLQLRIGIHSGPCAAGVVGIKMPRYCLFGDTVNTASRMESCSEAMKIHTSSQTKAILDTFHTFQLTLRGDIEVKGKGILRTYWLEGETPERIQKQNTV